MTKNLLVFVFQIIILLLYFRSICFTREKHYKAIIVFIHKFDATLFFAVQNGN